MNFVEGVNCSLPTPRFAQQIESILGEVGGKEANSQKKTFNKAN